MNKDSLSEELFLVQFTAFRMPVTFNTIMEIYKTVIKNVTKRDPCEGVNNISH